MALTTLSADAAMSMYRLSRSARVPRDRPLRWRHTPDGAGESYGDCKLGLRGRSGRGDRRRSSTWGAGVRRLSARQRAVRRITRWEHEAVLEAMQRRLDHEPGAIRIRRQTVEHVFGTIKAWMGATHFRTRRLKNVASEMSLQVLALQSEARHRDPRRPPADRSDASLRRRLIPRFPRQSRRVSTQPPPFSDIRGVRFPHIHAARLSIPSVSAWRGPGWLAPRRRRRRCGGRFRGWLANLRSARLPAG